MCERLHKVAPRELICSVYFLSSEETSKKHRLKKRKWSETGSVFHGKQAEEGSEAGVEWMFCFIMFFCFFLGAIDL